MLKKQGKAETVSNTTTSFSLLFEHPVSDNPKNKIAMVEISRVFIYIN
jgi:hypothetical protein